MQASIAASAGIGLLIMFLHLSICLFLGGGVNTSYLKLIYTLLWFSLIVINNFFLKKVIASLTEEEYSNITTSKKEEWLYRIVCVFLLLLNANIGAHIGGHKSFFTWFI